MAHNLQTRIGSIFKYTHINEAITFHGNKNRSLMQILEIRDFLFKHFISFWLLVNLSHLFGLLPHYMIFRIMTVMGF